MCQELFLILFCHSNGQNNKICYIGTGRTCAHNWASTALQGDTDKSFPGPQSKARVPGWCSGVWLQLGNRRSIWAEIWKEEETRGQRQLGTLKLLQNDGDKVWLLIRCPVHKITCPLWKPERVLKAKWEVGGDARSKGESCLDLKAVTVRHKKGNTAEVWWHAFLT